MSRLAPNALAAGQTLALPRHCFPARQLWWGGAPAKRPGPCLVHPVGRAPSPGSGMPVEGVKALVQFMKEFENEHQ